jgi:hypothetical protein
VPELLEASHAQAVAAMLPAEPSDQDFSLLDPTDDAGDPDRSVLRRRLMTREACVNDFRLLSKVNLFLFGGAALSDGTPEGEAFLKTYNHIFTHLRHAYDVSDRSCAHFFRLARAHALLDERRRVDPRDAVVLAYCGKDPHEARRLPAIVEGLLTR